MQRGPAVGGGLRVQVRVAVGEELDHFLVAAVGGKVEGGPAGAVLQVDVAAARGVAHLDAGRAHQGEREGRARREGRTRFVITFSVEKPSSWSFCVSEIFTPGTYSIVSTRLAQSSGIISGTFTSRNFSKFLAKRSADLRSKLKSISR